VTGAELQRSGLLALALSLSACKSDTRREHEKLIPALEPSVKILCGAFLNTEGGGCQRDCQTRLAAQAGHAAWRGSERLAVLGPFADPATEALLVPIRERARELRSSLGGACTAPVTDDAPVTPDVERCAESKRAASGTLHALRTALDALARTAKDRVGAELPSIATSCRED
jgi:hypothetical protein